MITLIVVQHAPGTSHNSWHFFLQLPMVWLPLFSFTDEEIEEGKGTQQVTRADAGQRAAIPKHCSFHALSLVPDLALRLVSWWDYS